MGERVSWAQTRAGDVLLIRGARWTVERVDPDGSLTLQSQSGAARRTGRPDPAGVVTVVERGPKPDPKSALTPLRPEPLCGHWIGAEERYCGLGEDVRPFVDGHRCPEHAPGLVQARAAGRRACESCGQPVPEDSRPDERCMVCKKPIKRRK